MAQDIVVNFEWKAIRIADDGEPKIEIWEYDAPPGKTMGWVYDFLESLTEQGWHMTVWDDSHVMAVYGLDREARTNVYYPPESMSRHMVHTFLESHKFVRRGDIVDDDTGDDFDLPPKT